MVSKDQVDTVFAYVIPGNSRVLSKEEIAREYGERAIRPIPAGYKKPSAATRIQVEQMKPFLVYRIHATGKCDFMSSHVTMYEAEAEAGKLRDAMTDHECSLDYTYEARERKRGYRR